MPDPGDTGASGIVAECRAIVGNDGRGCYWRKEAISLSLLAHSLPEASHVREAAPAVADGIEILKAF